MMKLLNTAMDSRHIQGEVIELTGAVAVDEEEEEGLGEVEMKTETTRN